MPRVTSPRGGAGVSWPASREGLLPELLLKGLHHLFQGLYLPSLQQGGGRGERAWWLPEPMGSPFWMGRAGLKPLPHPGCSYHFCTSDEPFL